MEILGQYWKVNNTQEVKLLLKDKIVVVSGIGPGLGQELAMLAAREGAAGLVICARTASKLADCAAAIGAEGLSTRVLQVSTDIADRSQCKALVAQAMQEFGRIDILLNSAYVPGSFAPILEADLDGWRQAMDVNLFGTMNLTLEVAQVMKAQGGGSIVMVNTMVTRKPLQTQGGYGASKAALLSATQHLALELGQYNIRVNTTFMGWMWGPPVEGYFQQAAEEAGAPVESLLAEVEKSIPLGRIPDDGDCAKAVIMLASDYACVVTGAGLDVNGGEFMTH
jgi:NAD(P)-dependent dehydrogenase (short-subunit alcohol dehydrogenase family)